MADSPKDTKSMIVPTAKTIIKTVALIILVVFFLGLLLWGIFFLRNGSPDRWDNLACEPSNRIVLPSNCGQTDFNPACVVPGSFKDVPSNFVCCKTEAQCTPIAN